MDLEILRKIGLSEGEIKIYSALLESGRSAISSIHEKTGIERRNIYDILNKLIEKGLVNYITENKKRFFQVASPQKIISYLEEKEQEIEKTKHEVNMAIPSLIKTFESNKTEINAQIYRGIEGIKTVWDDMLNYKEIRWIGSGRYIPIMYPQFFMRWNKKRIKSRIIMLNLVRYELRKKIKHFKLEYIKFLPKEFSGNPIVICIYGNKIVNFIFSKDFFAFSIENKELVENYKRYHQYLWDNISKY